MTTPNRAVLDHVGIAVADIEAALRFYRDALGLEVAVVEEVASQRVRAHFVPTGGSGGGSWSCSRQRPTTRRSPKFVGRRGPGLHHITLRVAELGPVLDDLRRRGVRLIDEQPRPGAEGARVAFIHPASTHGVLVELKEDRRRETRRVTDATPVRIGVVGGSGLYDMAELVDREEVVVSTPFGNPSAPYVVGTLDGQRVAFLARHGTGHRLLPSELNFRANIFGLKTLGVEWIISASAVGSLQERYPPLDIVVPDQFFDRTRGASARSSGAGIVGHITFAHPVCGRLSGIAADAADAVGATVHRGGTYVCMEGPQFSTLAESNLYRSWKMDVIGMTNLQEAKLAREAEICYTTVALVTDYDCWHPDHDSVTIDMIVQNVMQNAETARKVIRQAVAQLPVERTCECATALSDAIITRPEAIPEQVKTDLAPLIGKYLP